MIRNGGSSLLTNVTGLADFSSAMLSPGLAPNSLAYGLLMSSKLKMFFTLGSAATCFLTIEKSAGPKMSLTRSPATGLLRVLADLGARFRPAGRAQQRHQVPAGRPAPHADALGVEVVLPAICPQEAEGRLAILDLRGEDRLVAEAVFDA